jgi:hypothetical protein
MEDGKVKNEVELMCKKEFTYYEDMYKVIDFMNKNLSESNIILGISESNGKHVISIYKESDTLYK